MSSYYVDKDECIGCELCTTICPEVFKMDDDGKAVTYGAADVPDAETALESCPTNAIKKN